MARHTYPVKRKIDEAFPIRVKIRVPSTGLGNRLSDINAWLRESGDGARTTSTASIGGNAMAIYFRSPVTVLQFVEAFPDVELADGVERAGLD